MVCWFSKLSAMRVRARVILSLAVCAAILGAFACGGGNDPDTPSGTAETHPPTASGTPTERALTSLDLPVKIAVSLPIFEDFVRQAAGDHAEVFSIVPPGVDPRTYEPTAEDAERIAGVLFFYVNGLGLDDHIQDWIEEHRDERSFVIPFGPNVRSPTAEGYADEAGDEAHLYLDPDLAAIYVAIVADEFTIYDEVNRAFYDERFRGEVASLKGLANDLAGRLEAIPDQRRLIVGRSESLTHIGRRFALSIVALASDAPATEADADTIARLTSEVSAQNVPAVFGEFGHDNSLIEEVARQGSVELCILYTDIGDETVVSYEAMTRANVDELIRCLGE